MPRTISTDAPYGAELAHAHGDQAEAERARERVRNLVQTAEADLDHAMGERDRFPASVAAGKADPTHAPKLEAAVRDAEARLASVRTSLKLADDAVVRAKQGVFAIHVRRHEDEVETEQRQYDQAIEVYRQARRSLESAARSLRLTKARAPHFDPT